MADVSKMSDEDLAAAAAEIEARRVARAEEQRAAEQDSIQFLLDVGIGSDNRASLSEMTAALEAGLNDLPRELYVHANALLLGGRALDGAIRNLAAPVLAPMTSIPPAT